MVSGGHSRYIDIDLNDVSIKQRQSAFQGEIKSERYTKLSAEAEEPITRKILKPSGNPFMSSILLGSGQCIFNLMRQLFAAE